MLQRLLIKNYVLIEQVELFPVGGLNVITGETGAGKSILLGALDLLRGARLSSIRRPQEGRKCVVEAEFSHAGGAVEKVLRTHELDVLATTLLRREVTPDGRSRHFLNDSPVDRKTLKEVCDSLIDAHSQHQSIQLATERFQRELLDAYGKLTPAVRQHRTAYEAYMVGKKRHEEHLQHADKVQAQREEWLTQHEELEQFALKAGEEEALEQEYHLLSHAQSVQECLRSALDTLHDGKAAILLELYGVKRLLQEAQDKVPALADYTERIDSTYIELEDIARDLQGLTKHTTPNPERLEEVQKRLHALRGLQKKYKLRTAKELFALQEDMRQRIAQVADQRAQAMREKLALENSKKALVTRGCALSEARKKAARLLEEATRKQLKKLGLNKATFSIRVLPAHASWHGADKIQFLFSANAGMAAHEIGKIASGGELSRLMLVIKHLVGEKDKIPTMVFDEIDTGISGEPSYQMIRMVEDIAKHHQVIGITHLPQFARRGDAHFCVYKEEKNGRHQTFIKQLDNKARVKEIAKMIGGNRYRQRSRDMLSLPTK